MIDALQPGDQLVGAVGKVIQCAGRKHQQHGGAEYRKADPLPNVAVHCRLGAQYAQRHNGKQRTGHVGEAGNRLAKKSGTGNHQNNLVNITAIFTASR